MKPRTPTTVDQGDLYRARLDQILDPTHGLFQLARKVNWGFFEKEFGTLYVEGAGRPGLSTRLMVGLHLIKALFDESDESVVEKFVENPYWQDFCGLEYFVHQFPCDPTSLVRFRKRIGSNGMEKLFAESLWLLEREGAITKPEMRRVVVDTTVQEKAVAFPVDARLYQRMREKLVVQAEREGLSLRQTYRRLGKSVAFQFSRYARAGQFRRAARQTKRLRTFLGRVIRDIRRKATEMTGRMKGLLETAERLLVQKRDDTQKIYSVHAPEVECIARGKARKKYEFGCKVGLLVTARKGIVVGVGAFHGRPYDGKVLTPLVEQARKLTKRPIEEVFADQGFRGEAYHPQGVRVHISGPRKRPWALRRWMKRRQSIEPVIGHLKSEHGMDRNHLLGRAGDQINALLAASAWNLKKLLRALLLCLRCGNVSRPLVTAMLLPYLLRLFTVPQPKTVSWS